MKTHLRKIAKWEPEAFPSVWALARAYVSDMETFSDRDKEFLSGCIRARDPFRILRWCDEVEAYSSLDRCREVLQVKAFFSKNEDLGKAEAKLETARASFARAEMFCRITNKRLDFYARHPERHPFREEEKVARKVIADILGSTRDALDRIPLHLEITSGATSTDPRKRSKPFMKVRKTYTVTEKAIPFCESFLRLHGFPGSPKYQITRANTVITVPKNLKTDRTIAKEPVGNLPFQLAFDGYMKKRLFQVGIDLKDQLRNQMAAREGSLTDLLSTIDLSMASDTVSINAVATLLPDDWYVLFDALRCSEYSGAFGHGYYSKFSSMGNGLTFALETIIFYALCKAAGSVQPLVYGDDIIVESSVAPKLVQLLRFYGFRPNLEKTFIQGPFRESCGADWYEGTNVRAFYLKHHPRTVLDAHVVSNGLLSRTNPGSNVWKLLKGASHMLSLVPFGADASSGIICHPRDIRLSRDPDTHSYRFRGKVRIEIEAREITDVRAYYLWHLKASKRKKDLDDTSHPDLRSFALHCMKQEEASKVEDDEYARVFIRDSWLTLRTSASPIPPYVYMTGSFFGA